MYVRELIEKLKMVDPDLPVLAWDAEDGAYSEFVIISVRRDAKMGQYNEEIDDVTFIERTGPFLTVGIS